MRKYVLLLLLLLIPLAHARSGHITALSVSDENETRGGIADLYLEIRPGHGAVYIESTPLTKIDTQVSTRFAKEAACQISTVDCEQYDFFYVIEIPSSVIGGPSAGGALSVLTYAVLEDLTIDNNTAMTGSIMSGGLIGPVGGVAGKVAAAQYYGYNRVIVPAIESNVTSDQIEVVRVQTLNEAIYAFTGKQPQKIVELSVPEEYTKAMLAISNDLCERAQINIIEMEKYNNTNRTALVLRDYERAMNATKYKAYYTSASLCFSASLLSTQTVLEHASVEKRQEVLEEVHRKQIAAFNDLSKAQINTIADLEVAMVVSERLDDASRAIRTTNRTDPEAAKLAYSYERLHTSKAWLSLIGKIPSKEIDISRERIAFSCNQKLQEAQERVNYLTYIYPQLADQFADSIKEAFASAEREEYTLCLLQASQAQAQANSILTAIYVPEDNYQAVIMEKLAAAKRAISLQSTQQIFPILAYSYAEYSEQLIEAEPYSASLYVEYSIELSRLGIYFPEREQQNSLNPSLISFGAGILLGSIIGILGSIVLFRLRTRQPKNATPKRSVPGKKR
jgi:uncharacterized protein